MKVDAWIVERFRSDGHEVLYVAEVEPGISDEIVLERAMQTGSILVTQDKEFGEPVFRQGLATHGVILIRLSGLAAEEKAKVVSVVLATRRAQMAGASPFSRPQAPASAASEAASRGITSSPSTAESS